MNTVIIVPIDEFRPLFGVESDEVDEDGWREGAVGVDNVSISFSSIVRRIKTDHIKNDQIKSYQNGR